MTNQFDPQEHLLRAVWPADKKPHFWRNGKLSTAALKDSRGLSVDRTHDRTVEVSTKSMLARGFQGFIVSFSVADCDLQQVCLKYLPNENHPYHSEIHGSETEIQLSNQQALALARTAVIRHDPDATSTP